MVDGTAIAAVIGTGSVVVVAIVAGSVKIWRAIGRLEGKMDGLDSEAFGRLEGKVGSLDKRMHSYEIQMTGFDQKMVNLNLRLNGFVDTLLSRRKKKA